MAAIKVVDTTADIPPNEEIKLDSPAATSGLTSPGAPNGSSGKETQNPLIGAYWFIRLKVMRSLILSCF
jgi:hypothetical protein